MVETDPEERVPPNRAQRRQVNRLVRMEMRRLTTRKPTKRKKPGARKWNAASKRHLARYVNAMEKRAAQLQSYMEGKAA